MIIVLGYCKGYISRHEHFLGEYLESFITFSETKLIKIIFLGTQYFFLFRNGSLYSSDSYVILKIMNYTNFQIF